jgi:hypothetical protein
MKIIEFFLIKWGKLSELEPEPKFLTSWSQTTLAKTVIPECSTLLQILLYLVTFLYTCDRKMWRYRITVIAHEELFCKWG